MLNDLLKHARRPAVATTPGSTVRELADLLVRERVGAAVVLEDERLVGIVSERDVIARVLAARRDPDTTLVREIMTSDVRTSLDARKGQPVLDMMVAGSFRHLPVVDAAGKVVGMLSLRHLLQHRVDELDRKTNDLLAFISTDGAGG
jgi:CBS domain-containing protein